MDKEEAEKWEQFYRANYVALGRDPHWWLFQAQLLKKAADVVLEQVKIDEDSDVVQTGWITNIWKYLVGMSVENILKGIIIAGADDPAAREHPYIHVDRMEEWLTRHAIWTKYANNSDNLKALKKLLTGEEEDLLKILERYVVSMGRYHIATTANNYITDQHLRQRLDLSLKKFEAVVDALYEKLSRELVKKVEEFTEKHGPSGALFIG
jgi:hypothetical protein